jgi:hypothetical protein
MALLQCPMVAIMLLATALAGCGASQFGDTLPTAMGGLPEGAPARSNVSRQYPAVHDMPTPRASHLLNEEEAFKLEKELQATRDRQAKETIDPAAVPPPAPAKKAAPAPKKQAGAGNTAPKAAAKTSGAKTNP